jgi:hypothetical protein
MKIIYIYFQLIITGFLPDFSRFQKKKICILENIYFFINLHFVLSVNFKFIFKVKYIENE